jgi:signal transduction histidine kinase
MREGKRLNFRVSPQVLAPLGMEQLHDPALAVLELVKNSWDANATRVEIDIKRGGDRPFISVCDNGDGMGLDEFRDRWLVIGSSHKRGLAKAPRRRPLIGEKGLGRLASYALGADLSIQSSRADGDGFEATLNWDSLLKAASIEDYKILVSKRDRKKGTNVEVSALKFVWAEEHTNFLTTHTQFLTSVPGERFLVTLKVDGQIIRIQDPLETIASISEGEIDVEVGKNGEPRVVRCVIEGVDFTGTQFRDFPSNKHDARLAHSRVELKFYRRDKATRKLSSVLSANVVSDVLERYQGVRIYRDGINVPPYGLHGDDWAALEKQRTSTGGPTMVPGNSQLTGEVRIPAAASHLVITAGRSGFSDQSAVRSLAAYVQWVVRELGTARRAQMLGIRPGDGPVPTRVEGERRELGDEPTALSALKEVADNQAIRKDPELRSKLIDARKDVEQELRRNEETLRLYAQLASTGIAATSFAHEMRADFDVISAAASELSRNPSPGAKEWVQLLESSWRRVVNFVALFKVVPVKVRRSRRTLSSSAVMSAMEAVASIAPPDKIKVHIVEFKGRLSMVPAEFDSVLLNLVSNAIKAIGESSSSARGKIRIALIAKGEDLQVCVADNGCGVSKRVESVMFEPLEGKFAEGTGMGLPIVKFIAERYLGSVALHAAPSGYATELRVLLKGVVK